MRERLWSICQWLLHWLSTKSKIGKRPIETLGRLFARSVFLYDRRDIFKKETWPLRATIWKLSMSTTKPMAKERILREFFFVCLVAAGCGRHALPAGLLRAKHRTTLQQTTPQHLPTGACHSHHSCKREIESKEKQKLELLDRFCHFMPFYNAKSHSTFSTADNPIPQHSRHSRHGTPL